MRIAEYYGKPIVAVMREHGYEPHVKARGEEQVAIQNGFKVNRWIVEAAHLWLNRFRKILVRFEKKTGNYEALLHLTAGIIIFRKLGIIYG